MFLSNFSNNYTRFGLIKVYQYKQKKGSKYWPFFHVSKNKHLFPNEM